MLIFPPVYSLRPSAQPKKLEAVDVLPGDLLGDGAERAIDMAFELETLRQDSDLQLLVFVIFHDDSAGWW